MVIIIMRTMPTMMMNKSNKNHRNRTVQINMLSLTEYYTFDIVAFLFPKSQERKDLNKQTSKHVCVT